jgi:glycosyltransferase 2 family protein
VAVRSTGSYNGYDMAKKPAQSSVLSLAKGRLLLLLFFLLLLYVVVPRLGNFSQSFAVLGDARPVFIGLALAGLVLTYLFAAIMYFILAFKPLRLRQILVVQTASGFANRVLPGGLGVITLYVQYLRKHGHTLSQAIAVSGTNNLLGIIEHVLLMALALGLTAESLLGQADFSYSGRFWLILGVVVAAAVTGLLVFSQVRRYLYSLTKDVFKHMAHYRKRPGKLAMAFLCSVLLTLSHVSIFYFSALALGVEVSLTQAFVVFTVGIIAATVTPTPGGLVGAEAGLTAGLIVYGVAAPTALATALLYRFLTYWLPLLPGFIVFITNRRLYL